jgi:hypothetical protein
MMEAMAPPVTEVRDVDYLVIAPKDFHKALRPLITHRAKQDRVRIVDPDSIYLAASSTPKQQAIQQFVRQISPKYLLIVGDDSRPTGKNEIPEGAYPAQGDRPMIFSDAFYGDLRGDPLPEVAVGRIPAHSAAEVKAVVRKILAYERSRPVASRSTLALYGGRGNFGAIADLALEARVFSIVRDHVPPAYAIDVHYDEKSSAFHTQRNFVDFLNAGGFLLNYSGHGASSWIQTDPPFGLAQLKDLNLRGRRPILNLLACQAGCFAGKTCLGEALFLHRDGPVAVIGSNEVISPLVLDFVARTMAKFLHQGSGVSVGDVMLAAQRSVTGQDNDLLWRVLKLLPKKSIDTAYLKPNPDEAARRQIAQWTFLGDPRLAWRPGLSVRRVQRPQANDPRQAVGANLPAMASRIVIDAAARVEPNVVDTRQLGTKDLASVLSLLDYFAWRAPKVLGRLSQHLPTAGEVTVKNGIFFLPVHHLTKPLEIQSHEMHERLRNMLFSPTDAGAVRVTGPVTFSIRLTSQELIISNMTGIEVHSTSGLRGRQIIDSLAVPHDNPEHISVTYGALPVAPKDIAAVNRSLSKTLAGNMYGLQVGTDPHSGRVHYYLMQRLAGQSGHHRIAKLHPFNAGQQPLVTKNGVLLPLTYGVLASELVETTKGQPMRIRLEEMPMGLKRQYYLYLPFKRHETYVNGHELIRGDFLSDNRLGREKQRYDIMSVISAVPSVPLYEAFPDEAQISVAMRGAFGAVKGERLFGERARTKREEKGFEFSGAIGGDIAIVIDGSGSMGAQVAPTLQFFAKQWDTVPSFARHFVEVSVIVTTPKGPKMLLERTSLSSLDKPKIVEILNTHRFTGASERLSDGLEYGIRLVDPASSGAVVRYVFLLTDPEGQSDDRFADFTQNVEIVDVTQLTKPKKGVPGEVAPKPPPPVDVSGLTLEKARVQMAGLVKGLDASDAASQQRATQAITDLVRAFVKVPVDEEPLQQLLIALKSRTIYDPTAIIPLLEQLVHGSVDLPLKTTAIETLGAFARRKIAAARLALVRLQQYSGTLMNEYELDTLAKAELISATSAAERAKSLFSQVHRDPASVDPKDITKCGPVPDAVRAMLHIIEYGGGRARNGAIEGLGSMLKGSAKDPTRAVLIAEVQAAFEDLVDLGSGYDKKVLATAATAIGIQVPE